MRTQTDAQTALLLAWPSIARQCRKVLGFEQHYQAVVYHCLRTEGRVPLQQLGMNVKMWIERPRSKLFRLLDKRKHEDYWGGFEPIPDVVISPKAIEGDWRRRRRDETLKHMVGAVEIKASERAEGRLQPGELFRDIEKLAAHREEKKCRHKRGLYAAMVATDTAPDEAERMTKATVDKLSSVAQAAGVEFFYLSKRRSVSPESD